ncbi:MAG: cardiolipin synthase [Planctomycetes bacterium]|nr:cardiolipin synthase [Planctomycetota bacterium]
MLDPAWIPLLVVAVDVVVVACFGLRVVSVRHPVGVTLAWLAVLLAVPFGGAALYLLLGERRLGHRREERARAVLALYRGWLAELRLRPAAREVELPERLQGLARQLEAVAGMPPLGGNELRLTTDAHDVLQGIARDIDGAQTTVHLLFYIWHGGGAVELVEAALLRAAARGVRCRVLVDAVGSRSFLNGPLPGRLHAAGVEVLDALPVGIVRALFRRLDLRNHRKLAVIDGEIAWTGSQNLADPRHFKISAGVGRWIDSSVRVRGPVVEALAGVFLADWELEAQKGRAARSEPLGVFEVPPRGHCTVQVLPSGPAYAPEGLHRVLITALFAARRELILTTPYFVPDDSMLAALCAAAQRGADVLVVLPRKIDSFLVRHASRSHFDELLEAGVRIVEYPDGLLHAKTITIDGELSLIGSPNLDMRSFWLNFELTLIVYDTQITAELRDVQLGFATRSRAIDLQAWRERPFRRRLLENTVQLASPLL